MKRWWPYDVTIKREPRDLWLGLYRTGREWVPKNRDHHFNRWRWYICAIPCFPIVITWIEDFDR